MKQPLINQSDYADDPAFRRSETAAKLAKAVTQMLAQEVCRSSIRSDVVGPIAFFMPTRATEAANLKLCVAPYNMDPSVNPASWLMTVMQAVRLQESNFLVLGALGVVLPGNSSTEDVEIAMATNALGLGMFKENVSVLMAHARADNVRSWTMSIDRTTKPVELGPIVEDEPAVSLLDPLFSDLVQSRKGKS